MTEKTNYSLREKSTEHLVPDQKNSLILV